MIRAIIDCTAAVNSETSTESMVMTLDDARRVLARHVHHHLLPDVLAHVEMHVFGRDCQFDIEGLSGVD